MEKLIFLCILILKHITVTFEHNQITLHILCKKKKKNKHKNNWKMMITSDPSHFIGRYVLHEKWQENAIFLCQKNVEYCSALDSTRKQTGRRLVSRERFTTLNSER